MKSHKTASDGTESLPRGYRTQRQQDAAKEAVQWATAPRMRNSTQEGRWPGGVESRPGKNCGRMQAGKGRAATYGGGSHQVKKCSLTGSIHTNIHLYIDTHKHVHRCPCMCMYIYTRIHLCPVNQKKLTT